MKTELKLCDVRVTCVLGGSVAAYRKQTSFRNHDSASYGAHMHVARGVGLCGARQPRVSAEHVEAQEQPQLSA